MGVMEVTKKRQVIFGVLALAGIIVAGVVLFGRLEVPDQVVPTLGEYYGRSTLGACQSDADCYISGCNSEICQSRLEEGLSSICVIPDKPLPQEFGYQCGCYVDGEAGKASPAGGGTSVGQCQWLR